MTPSVKVHKREPVEPTERKAMTPYRRKSALAATGGKCGLCNMPIGEGEPFEVDHKKPLEQGGLDTPANLQALHPRCHALKTAADRQRITKSKHQRAFHNGTKADPIRKLEGRGFEPANTPTKWPSRPFPKRQRVKRVQAAVQGLRG